MLGSPEQQETAGLLDQQIPESFDGWHGRGLSDLARLIEYDPRLEGHALGAIGSSDHPAIHGYTREQLAGVLRRWELEPSHHYPADKLHWELAALDAVQTMAGEIREPLAGLVTTRMATLQEKIMESRTGVWKNNAVSRETDVFDATDHSSRPHIHQQMQLIQAQQKAADVLSTAGSVVYAVVKRPYLVLPVFALAACSAFGGKTESTQSPTSSPHMTETIPAPTAILPPIEPTDPDRPADAIGGRDPETGYYTKKAEDGVTTLYYISNQENPALNGWYKSNMKNGPIPLIDIKVNRYGVPNTMFISFFSKADKNLPTIGVLSHPDISDEYKDGINDSKQLTFALSNRLLGTIYWHFYPMGSKEDTPENLSIFMTEFASDTTGKYMIPIQVRKDLSDPKSEFTTILWNPAKDGVQTIQVGWEDLNPTTGPIYDIKSPFPLRIQYLLEDGALKAFVATSKTNLTDEEKNILALAPLSMALSYPTLPQQLKSISNIPNGDGSFKDITIFCWDPAIQIGLSKPYIVFGE